MLTLSSKGSSALSEASTVSTAAPAVPSSQPSAQPSASDAALFDRALIKPNSEPHSREQIRHLLFGTPTSIQATIRRLHQLGYAEPNDWSRPISTGRPSEVMAVLTKRIGL